MYNNADQWKSLLSPNFLYYFIKPFKEPQLALQLFEKTEKSGILGCRGKIAQTSYAKYNTHTVMKSQLRIEWRTVSSHFIKSQLATEAKQRYNTIFCKINWWKMSVVLCICILKSKKALISHNTKLSAWRLLCKGNRLKMKNKANNLQCSAPQTYMCSDSIV